MRYPDDLPSPQIAGYGYTVGQQLTRIQMENGKTRQRRGSNHQPHTMQLQFAVPIKDWKRWQQAVNIDAYLPGNFEMNLTTFMGVCSTHWVQFVSDIEVTALTDKVVTASVTALVQPYDGLNTPPPEVLGQWIIAHDPANPAPDWVIANTPAAPNTDWILPGTPAAPAVV